jgi:hypothetical protein
MEQDPFTSSYAFAFRRYVAHPNETLLRAAYELGRQAVERGLSVLDLGTAHHEAVRSALRADPVPRDLEDVVSAAEGFFVESLGAFEMVQRGFHEAREAAAQEKRQAAMVRRLSGVLADASLAIDGSASLKEMLDFVAEQARELTEATTCTVVVAEDGDAAVEAVAHTDPDLAWPSEAVWTELPFVVRGDFAPDVGGGADLQRQDLRDRDERRNDVVSATLTSLDGRVLGRIEVAAKHGGGRFSELDEAVLVHLAQMVSAAVERAAFHQTDYGRKP